MPPGPGPVAPSASGQKHVLSPQTLPTTKGASAYKKAQFAAGAWGISGFPSVGAPLSSSLLCPPSLSMTLSPTSNLFRGEIL
jgi:hypothetical protein